MLAFRKHIIVVAIAVGITLSGCHQAASCVDSFRIERISDHTEKVSTTVAGLPSKCNSSALIVGSWNIWWLGYSDPESRNYVTMADFIEECEVVAVQELRGDGWKKRLDAIMAELKARGHNYTYRESEWTGYDKHPGGRSEYLERYAFIYDVDRVRMKGMPHFMSLPPINNQTFRQVPFVADFKVKSGKGFDFRILTTHTVYSKPDPQGYASVREGEIKAIRAWMIKEAKGKEQNIIAIGDFNANPPSQKKHHYFRKIIKDIPVKQGETRKPFRVLMYESKEVETPVRTTVPRKDSSPNPEYFQEPVYDHILVSDETSYAMPSKRMARKDGNLGVYEFDNDPKWKKAGIDRNKLVKIVSDHRPIWFRLKYFAADKDKDD